MTLDKYLNQEVVSQEQHFDNEVVESPEDTVIQPEVDEVSETLEVEVPVEAPVEPIEETSTVLTSHYTPLSEMRLQELHEAQPVKANLFKPELAEARIAGVTFTEVPNYKGEVRTVVCVITCTNGFQTVGVSQVIDIANYNQELGQHYAYKDAFSKLIPCVVDEMCNSFDKVEQ